MNGFYQAEYQFDHKTGTCVEIDACGEKPCENGGVCSNFKGGFVCQCMRPWTGLTCNEPDPVCDCVINGKKHPGLQLGEDGLSCIDVNECLSDAICGKCEKCVNSVGSYECVDVEGSEGYGCISRVSGLVKILIL